MAVLEACKYVDEVIPNAPIKVTKQFMEEHNVRMVVHGNKMDPVERQTMYGVPIEMGHYTEVHRTAGISTTDLIDRVADRMTVRAPLVPAPAVRAATSAAVSSVAAEVAKPLSVGVALGQNAAASVGFNGVINPSSPGGALGSNN